MNPLVAEVVEISSPSPAGLTEEPADVLDPEDLETLHLYHPSQGNNGGNPGASGGKLEAAVVEQDQLVLNKSQFQSHLPEQVVELDHFKYTQDLELHMHEWWRRWWRCIQSKSGMETLVVDLVVEAVRTRSCGNCWRRNKPSSEAVVPEAAGNAAGAGGSWKSNY